MQAIFNRPATPIWDVEGDSTDAMKMAELSTAQKLSRGTLLTRFGDSADANRSYPGDFTDEANS